MTAYTLKDAGEVLADGNDEIDKWIIGQLKEIPGADELWLDDLRTCTDPADRRYTRLSAVEWLNEKLCDHSVQLDLDEKERNLWVQAIPVPVEDGYLGEGYAHVRLDTLARIAKGESVDSIIVDWQEDCERVLGATLSLVEAGRVVERWIDEGEEA